MSDLPETFVTHSADGTLLAYHVTGTGPLDVVCTDPGVPTELLWEYPGFRRTFTRLAKFSRVITVDSRGLGASGGGPGDSFEGDIDDADLVAVLDAAEAEQAVLVGWSVNGMLTMHFATTHPERVNALILINSCAHYVREDDYPWGFPRERLDDVAAILEQSWGTAAELDMTAPSQMADDRLRAVWGRARRSGVTPHAYAEGLRRSLEFDVRALLPSISARTLVLHREGDRFIHLGAGRYLAEHIPGAELRVLPGDDHLFFVGDTDALIDEIEEFLTGSHSGADANIVSTTVLFTDIVGSTEQQARLGSRDWSRLSDEHEEMVRDVLDRHHGRVIKTTGDGVLATFNANGRAVRCAIELVARAKRMGLELRAGLHTGDVEERGDDISGIHVNIASRVCDLAVPGQVLVSEMVKSATTASGFGFKEQGQYELKGVPGSWRLYQVMA